MKSQTVQRTEKRNEGKQAIKAHQRNGKAVSVAGATIKRPTPDEIIESCLFRDEQDAEGRIDILEIYRNRIPKSANRIFQVNVMRGVAASIEDRNVCVMLAVELRASDWHKLIANELDDAREWFTAMGPDPLWKQGGFFRFTPKLQRTGLRP